jgi:RES domain
LTTGPRTPGASEPFAVVPVTREHVQIWYHAYNTRFSGASATAFAQGWGNTRFAPLMLTDGSPVHTWYGASTFECALMESVFHDIPLNPPGHLDTARLKDYHMAKVQIVAPLPCVSFHTPFLPALNVTRTELIDSQPDVYSETQKWSQAAFDQRPDARAIAYGSRRDDSGRCVMLFGQRLPADALVVVADDQLGIDPYRTMALKMAESLGLQII